MSDLIQKKDVLRLTGIHAGTFARWCRAHGLSQKTAIGKALLFDRAEVLAILDKIKREQEPPPGYLSSFKVVDLFESDERNLSRQAKRLGIESVKVGAKAFYNEKQVLAAVPILAARREKATPKQQPLPGNVWIEKDEAMARLGATKRSFAKMLTYHQIEEVNGRYSLAQVEYAAEKLKAKQVAKDNPLATAFLKNKAAWIEAHNRSIKNV